MYEKFKGKYRRTSTRLKHWNYAWDAAYFITVCTKDKQPFFGNIEHGKMILSKTGLLANVFWHEIKSHANHVILDEFVVMPDHIHGILIICNNKFNDDICPDCGEIDKSNCRENACIFSGPNAVAAKNKPGNRFQNMGKNTLSSIIGNYKSAVTKHANRLGLEHAWQAGFDDRIIRDLTTLEGRRRYIRENPHNWDKES